jgi:hypothetical protein
VTRCFFLHVKLCKVLLRVPKTDFTQIAIAPDSFDCFPLAFTVLRTFLIQRQNFPARKDLLVPFILTPGYISILNTLPE